MTSEQLEALKNQAAGRWPVPAAKVEQLFAVMEAAIQEARNQALEDAARHFDGLVAQSDKRAETLMHSSSILAENRQAATFETCAAAIRAMKGKSDGC